VEAIIADGVHAALRAQQDGVLRQLEHGARRDFFEHADRVTLAVEVAWQVETDQIDIAHVRMRSTKCAYFGQQSGCDFSHVESCNLIWNTKHPESTHAVKAC
jgi:hypothetical protein